MAFKMYLSQNQTEKSTVLDVRNRFTDLGSPSPASAGFEGAFLGAETVAGVRGKAGGLHGGARSPCVAAAGASEGRPSWPGLAEHCRGTGHGLNYRLEVAE